VGVRLTSAGLNLIDIEPMYEPGDRTRQFMWVLTWVILQVFVRVPTLWGILTFD